MTDCTQHDTRADLAHVLGLSSNSNIMEIGVFNGEFSNIMKETFKPNMLYLVDPFEGQITSGDQDGNNVQTFEGETLYKNVCSKFENDKNVCVLRAYSHDLKMMRDNSLDLVYLDGDHSYNGCKSDLALFYNKIKHNGWICGHDFMMNYHKTNNVYDFGVKQAVIEFCVEHGLRIQHVFLDGCVSFAIRNWKL